MFIPRLYTVESVTAGHPDKVCDQISDAILDACLAQDPMSRVAVECFGAHGHLVIGGEVTTNAQVDYAAIAQRVYRQIGYTDDLQIDVHVVEQSREIAGGVDTGGAGDQGIMYGFACNETPEFLPRGVVLAHRLAERLHDLRHSLAVGPDGKTQVTITDGRITDVIVSTQHQPRLSLEQVRAEMIARLIRPTIGSLDDVHVHVNPAGAWHVGGFTADTGLTGRKIMVDTYGGFLPHGGGAFSGKDATKVDRSAAYMCRYVARTLVAEGKTTACLVSVAYAIGRAEPVMVSAVDEDGRDFSADVVSRFDFRPLAIIERLGLRSPMFQSSATYGHFGKTTLPWG